jgi:excisionase family DNA binding protein
MILLIADGNDSHWIRACAEHLRWCRRNGIPAPTEMAAFLDALVARRGQERPTFAAAAPPVQPASMGIESAAQALGVSPRTVRRLVASGRLSSFQSGRRRLIPSDAVTKYVEESAA